MAAPKIRQNPPVQNPSAGGEFCHIHGLYRPPYEALETRRKATQPGLSAPRAWRLLEQAERLRRTCPQCRDVVPSAGRWASRIRCAIAEAAAGDPFASRCPWCSTPYLPGDPGGDRHRCA